MTPARIKELRALVEAGTKGPWEHSAMRGLVRALRGDLAIPVFEVRAPYGDPLEDAPTVRIGGKVVFRANSAGAMDSVAYRRQHNNGELLVAALTEFPALLDEVERLRGALRSLVDGDASYSDNTIIITAGSHADAMRRMRLARQALEGGQ